MRKKYKLLTLGLTLALILSACADEQTLTLDEITAEAENAQDGMMTGNDDAQSANAATGPDQSVTGQSGSASTPNSSDTSAQPGNATSGQSGTDAAPQPVFVYVCGAVAKPGVYALPAGSRICDALEAAGGFSEDADVNRINLAGNVTDGMMLFFPETGEEIPEGMEVQTGNSETGEKQTNGLVNINTAGAEELSTLPGIGESKALAIVAYREEHGPFADKSDIKNVSGIGDSLYRKIEDLICV